MADAIRALCLEHCPCQNCMGGLFYSQPGYACPVCKGTYCDPKAVAAFGAHVAALETEVARLRGWFASLAFDRSADECITCVFCGQAGCDAQFVTRAGGVTAGHGMHLQCRAAARSQSTQPVTTGR